LESMAWHDQTCLFKGEDVVVARHGAGLTNLAFKNPSHWVIGLNNGTTTTGVSSGFSIWQNTRTRRLIRIGTYTLKSE
jgi:capsular polysaccharide biosynthesis protein